MKVANKQVVLTIQTTASFTQPAANATVTVPVTSTTPFAVNDPVSQINGGLYTVAAIISLTQLSIRNVGCDGNTAPAGAVPAGELRLAHGVTFTFTHSVAGTFTDVLPISARAQIAFRVRPATHGGGGGGGGGGGFSGGTGGGASGGSGGTHGGPACTERINDVHVSPGETLTIINGAAGTGGTGGNGGAAGVAGSPGAVGNMGTQTIITGSVTGVLLRTVDPTTIPTAAGLWSPGLGGLGGNPGLVGAGGAAKAGPGANAGKWGYAFGGTSSVTVPSSGAGGTTAGGAGGNVAAGGASGSNSWGNSISSINGPAGNNGGTGTATRGGGGSGSWGAGGSFGDIIATGGVTPETPTDGVGGIPGHGGNADTNAGITTGSLGSPAVNGQGGPGGGGGGGGGAGNPTGGTGANGGNGRPGCDGLAIWSGTFI